MARPEGHIDGDGPRADFARALRSEKAKAGITLQQISDRTHYSRTVLCDATRGVTTPTWSVAWAYLCACNEPKSRLQRRYWERFWEAARADSGEGGHGST